MRHITFALFLLLIIIILKGGDLKKKLDSFHQTSCNFVGISTVVCGSYWGLNKKFKMAAVAMVAKVQKMLNSLHTSQIFAVMFPVTFTSLSLSLIIVFNRFVVGRTLVMPPPSSIRH